MTYRLRVSRSGSRVVEHAVGELHQRSPLAFMLEKDYLSPRSNKNDVIEHVELSER